MTQETKRGIWERMMSVFRPATAPNALTSWGGISWDDWVRGNVAGEGVSEQTARAVSAVSACVNLIGGSVASMPVHLYRRKGDEREAYKSDLWWLLNERPSAAWSAASMWEYVMASRLFHGDAFVRIRRQSRVSPAIAAFEPLHPSHVVVERAHGGLIYKVRREDGTFESVHQDDMLHIAGPGFDGCRSMSQLSYGLRHAAGIALAADKQASTFIGDGVRPDFAIEVPGNMTAEQIDTLRRTFKDRASGQSSSRAPVVMAGGLKLHELTMTAKDAELLATRGFQIEEVCRVFGVPPFMVGHNEKTTSWGSGIEQMSIGFVKYTLQRHLVAIEQELNFKLFKTSRNFCEFVTAGLERGDIKGRFEAYRIALGRAGEPAWMRPSEARKLENLPPDPDLDNPPEAAPPPDTPMQDIASAFMAMSAREVPGARVDVGSPVINVTMPDIRAEVAAPVVHVAPAVVNIEPTVVNVAPPEVHFEALMPAQPAPVVNVAPAEVNVINTAPAVNAPPVMVINEVKPADVRVELPPRRTVTDVERDSAGRITRTEQVERDA